MKNNKKKVQKGAIKTFFSPPFLAPSNAMRWKICSFCFFFFRYFFFSPDGNLPMREKNIERNSWYSRRKKKLCKFNCILWRSFYSSLKLKPKRFNRRKKKLCRSALAGNRIEKSIEREVREVRKIFLYSFTWSKR